MQLNYLLIIALIVGFSGGIAYYFFHLKKKADNYTDDFENVYSLDYLDRIVGKTFSEISRQNIKEMNLSARDYEKKKDLKKETKENSKAATHGDKDAKKYVKTFVKDIIETKCNINKDTIDKVIRFDKINLLSSVEITEILLYVYMKEYGPRGLSEMIEANHLDRPKKDKYNFDEYCIDDEDMRSVYMKIMPKIQLTYEDKLEIVAQRLYEKRWGWSVADLLVETDIDEIDAGVSGIPDDSFDVSNIDMSEVTYSYESIWITYKALNIRLKCLAFESKDDLIRVCQSIYKYNAPNILSKETGKVIATTKRGQRAAVMRPPFADSYCFCLRKFDSAPSYDPYNLYKFPGSDLVIDFIKWTIREQRTTIVSGGQGTGKSTFLKALIRFVPNTFNLRLQEIQAELNLRFAFPTKNIIAFQETPSVSSQEGLNFQKKTNGTVNLIGEIADALAATFFVQTSRVASLFGMGTHHANTADGLITSFRDNLMQTKFCEDEKIAETMVAEIINMNIHLRKNEESKSRYIERVTEIIPLARDEYPMSGEVITDENFERIAAINTMEYQRRITDRKLFDTMNIFEYQNGEFVVVNMPTDKTVESIKKCLSDTERASFEADLDTMRQKLEQYNFPKSAS